MTDARGGGSPILAGCLTFIAVMAVVGVVVAWNVRTIRSWMDPAYRDPADLSVIEQVLRARYDTANLSVFWTTRTPPGSSLPAERPRRRRVSVHIVDSPWFAERAVVDDLAREIVQEVRTVVGSEPRIEIVLLERAGSGWKRRSFWFEGEADPASR